MSTATTVFGPSAAVNGTVTGLPGAVGLETSTSVIWLASGEVKAAAAWSLRQQLADAEPGDSFDPAGPAIHPGEHPGVNW